MNTSQTRRCALLSLLLILAASSNRLLGQECDSCGIRCQPAACSVLVPQQVTEYQTRVITRCRPEIRERMVAVCRDVPTTQTSQEEYTVLVPQTRMRTVAETIEHPVYGDIQLRTTAMSPQVEARQGTRTVTRLVAVQEERTACDSTPCCATCASGAPVVDSDPNAPPLPSGAASTRDAAVSGGACNTCAPRKVCTTSWKPVCQQETVQYPVTRFQPNAQLASVSYYEYQPETRLHEEPYVVEVPEKRMRTREITVMRTITEQRPEKYTVMVPYEEQIQVPVVTCRWVEQTVITR